MSASSGDSPSWVRVRLAGPEDVAELARLSRAVYGARASWQIPELEGHQRIFPEGQLVAEIGGTKGFADTPQLVGMAVSLVVDSRRWPATAPWREVTDKGNLTTHDPSGDLLYGAGVAVHPRTRGRGVAGALYAAREALLERLGLSVIRAGARIPGYGRFADRMAADRYIQEVVEGRRNDPTLSFQLAMGFRVVAIAPNYLTTDRESRGWAAIIEWRRPTGDR